MHNRIKLTFFCLIISIGVKAQIPSYVPKNGLEAWYPFNGNANDESGKGLNGSVEKAILTKDRFGILNKAYYFDSSRVITIPQSVNKNLYPLTISLWVQIDTSKVSGLGNLFGKYVAATWNGFLIHSTRRIDSVGNVTFKIVPWYIRDPGNRLLGLYGEEDFATDLIPGKWHHFVFTVGKDKGTAYLDGKLFDTHLWTGNSGQSTNPYLWQIGGFYDDWFKGNLDDVGVWNRELTSDEINKLYLGEGAPCSGMATVKDIDGNTYNTVQIGRQCWTKENLKVSKYNDGSIIPLDNSGSMAGNGPGQTWSTRTTGARTVYGHDINNLYAHGFLYNGYAASDLRNICPSGWHVPTDDEWTTLTDYLGGAAVAGGKMKSVETIWLNNIDATNASGFTALPSGLRNSYLGDFGLIGSEAFFWSKTNFNGWAAYNRVLKNSTSQLFRQPSDHVYSAWYQTGGSIRCLKDTIPTPPSGTTKVTFKAPKVNISCDSFVEIPIVVFNFKDILGAQGSINWDITKLTFEGIASYGPATLGLTSNDFGLLDTQKGKLSFIWNAPNLNSVSLPDSTPIFFLRYKVIDTKVNTIIKVSNDPIDIEVFNSNFEKLGVEVGDFIIDVNKCPISCGQTIKGNTISGKSNYYKYACSDHKMDGNEIIYEFDNLSTQNVVITLTDLVQDLDLFLMEYVTPMNPDRCVKSSTRTDGSYESIFVENLPKGKYYIVVEGYNKKESSFTLKIDCIKPRGFLDCANAQNVDCNKTYSGDTKLGKSNNNFYGSVSSVYYNGKELVYKFVAPQGATEVIAFLENLTSDVDFFVVDNCGNMVSSSLASTESNLSEEAILLYPVGGRTYYFVVDSPEGMEGGFNLRLECYGDGDGNGCCLPPPPLPNCNKKTLLLCNTPINDNNFNGDSRNKAYCTGVALAKEKLYYFEIKTAQEVEIILSNITKGKSLNIYLLNKCEPSGNCLAVGNKSSNSEDVILKNLAAGVYYIWVDGFKASDESTYTIEVRCKDIDCSNSPMNLSFTTAKINCNYNVSVNINSGGIPPFSYKWSNGNTTTQLNNVPPGNYTVTVTDKIFCQKDTFINLPSFRATKTVKIDSTICFGKCITFGKNTICTSGAYNETFFVAASCLDSIVTLNLTVAPPLTLPTIVSGVDCRYNITINPAGGKPPYSYLWKDGATTNPRTNLPAGTYSLTVSDASNCQKKDTSFVLVSLELNITQKIDSADCGKANGRIEVVTVNKIKSAVWQDSPTSSLVRENLKAGRYTLTLTDVNGCIKRFDFEVGEKDNCGCNFYTAISPNGDGKNDYFFIDCKKKGCPDVLEVCFPENEIVIFNRWGNVVFKAKPYKNDWDAQGLPDGVYYYQFRRDPNSKVEMGSIIVKK
jgi:uncharacterized protein (TIGR02145 family)/gliding motility-associated-like protein